MLPDTNTTVRFDALHGWLGAAVLGGAFVALPAAQGR